MLCVLNRNRDSCYYSCVVCIENRQRQLFVQLFYVYRIHRETAVSSVVLCVLNRDRNSCEFSCVVCVLIKDRDRCEFSCVVYIE